MGCSNCDTCEISEKRGCGTSSVFDWLQQIDQNNQSNTVEVGFKADRKEYYANNTDLKIKKGEWVVVEGNPYGYDIGVVTLVGDLAKLQLKRKNINTQKTPLKKIQRIATKEEKKKFNTHLLKEPGILLKATQTIKDFELQMKLSQVEMQGDGTKAVFYYTSDERVDFRELIKEFSRIFRFRVEMKQIGIRQEAAKLGGIGSCGRELCCSTWMTKYPSVSTKAARYQQLSINPQKISGQCGRLKCCLNFELDDYVESLKDFPNPKTKLKSKTGIAKYFKMDVFKQKLWYFYEEKPFKLIELSLREVNKILKQNDLGKTPNSIQKNPDNQQKNLTHKITESDLNRFS